MNGHKSNPTMVPSQCKAHLIDESKRTDKLWVNVERLAGKIDLGKKNILEKRRYLENLQICEKGGLDDGCGGKVSLLLSPSR